jgi:hypothetical protein
MSFFFVFPCFFSSFLSGFFRILPIGLRPSNLMFSRLLDHLSTKLPTYEQIPGLAEMIQFKRLLSIGDTSSSIAAGDKDAANKKQSGSTSAPSSSFGPAVWNEMIPSFIAHPITSAMPSEYLEKKVFPGQKMVDLEENERVLWSIMQIIVKYNGQVSIFLLPFSVLCSFFFACWCCVSFFH